MLSGIINKNEKGFTLIEIILISVIVLLIGVSIIMPFRGGKETWQGADKGSETIQNAVIGMEKVVREIKNSPGLTAFENSKIRFAILRQDTTDIDADGDTNEYIEKYAMVKRDGDYLKYGERDADSETEADWTLSDLAYPITTLTFGFKKADGSEAIPGTDDPADVKSILINLVTSDGGITIPLTSRAYLVMGQTEFVYNFDGTPDDPGEEGPDEDRLNELNDPSEDDPEPGDTGDQTPGVGLVDYVIFGDEGVELSNNVTINGNVGTRSLNGNPFIGENSTEINGYLVVKGGLQMENAVIAKKSVVAACSPSISTAYPCSSNFDNSSRVDGYFWTLNNITKGNGPQPQINKTVYILAGRTAPDELLKGDPKREDYVIANYDVANPETFPAFMRDPMDFVDVDVRASMWGTSVFPEMPPENGETLSGSSNNLVFKKKDQVLGAGSYGNIEVTNGSRIVIQPDSKFIDLVVRNSSVVEFAASGSYYFRNVEIGNSSKLVFNYSGSPGTTTGPIRLYIKDKMMLINSSSFDYYQGGQPIDGANLLYVEAYNGFSCSNSVQWRGFVYSPNGNIQFSNNTSIAGSLYSKKKVIIENHTQVTYVAPLYMDIAKLLDDKFYLHVEN